MGLTGCGKTEKPSGSSAGPGSTKKTTTGCAEDCKLVSLTVIKNATQTHVTGAKNWATVKKASDDVIVQAETTPNNAGCWSSIVWAGDIGSAVPGHPNQRALSRSASRKFHVVASLGGVTDSVDVWIIWADLEIKIGTGDTIDAGNDASGLAAGHNWSAVLGGGNKLGPMSSEGTTLTYAYTIGKMQAKATLSPVGIEDVVKSHWQIRRKKTKIDYDNAVLADSAHDEDDTSGASWLDLDPKSGSSTREIYDLDGPGVSSSLSGTKIEHTSESYKNFTQWATVTLDSELVCSDEKKWSYEARIDVDKKSDKVEVNTLRLSHITIPTKPHYSKR